MATGTLTRVGQHDWLSVSLLANQAYEFTADGLGAFGQVVVGDLTPATLRLGVTASPAAPGQPTAAFFRPTVSGTYYIDVSGDAGAAYTVAAQPVVTDYTDTTSTTGTITVNGGATSGTLANPGQHDWLAVQLTANQAYEFTVTGLSGFGQVEVGALDPATLRFDSAPLSGTPGSTVNAFFRPTTSGTYYIDVSDAGSASDSYTVAAQTVLTDYTDNTTTAGTVTVGGPATAGTLANAGQHDWLAVQLTANQAYKFTVTGLSNLALTEVGALDPATLRFGSAPLAGSTGAAIGAFFRPTTSGTYYIDVSDAGATGNSYTVAAQAVATDYTDNTTSTGAVAVNGPATAGTLANVGQHDWLAVQLAANQAYEFAVTGLSGFGQVEVGALDPATLRLGSTPFPGTPGSTVSAFFRPTTSGTYYLDVSDAGSASDNYTVSAQQVATDYTDNTTTTGTVTVGGPATAGTLANAGQHDWLAVQLAANQAYEFTVTGLSGFGQVEVGALDPATLRFDSAPLSGTPGSTVNAFFRPTTSGTYYIDVSDAGSASDSYTVAAEAVSTDYMDNPTTTGAVTPACYVAGAMILTPWGERPVEQLKAGGLVLTASGRARRIKWIGQRSYAGRFLAGNPRLQPIRFRAGALGGGLPRRDLLVSPLHAMLVDGVLVPAELLVNGASIVPTRLGRVDYHHIELSGHDVLLAEGAAAESFFDDDSRGAFHNAADYWARHGRDERQPAVCCAPRIVDGPVLARVRQRLAGVAEAA